MAVVVMVLVVPVVPVVLAVVEVDCDPRRREPSRLSLERAGSRVQRRGRKEGMLHFTCLCFAPRRELAEEACGEPQTATHWCMPITSKSRP